MFHKTKEVKKAYFCNVYLLGKCGILAFFKLFFGWHKELDCPRDTRKIKYRYELVAHRNENDYLFVKKNSLCLSRNNLINSKLSTVDT